MLKNRWPVRSCFLLILLATLAVPAMAQSSSNANGQGGIGVVVGVSAAPDQIYFGANFMAAKVASNFWFRPGGEVGFGDSHTLASFNGEFIYLIDIHKKPWSAYFGGGPALIIDTTHNDAPVSNSTNVGPGFNFLAGIRKSKGLFSEIKVGLMDAPEFKFGVGYTF